MELVIVSSRRSVAEDGFGPELLYGFSLGEPISGVGGYIATEGWSY